MIPTLSSSLSLVATDQGWDLLERPLPELADRPDCPTGLVRVCMSRASLSHTQVQVMSRQRVAQQGRVLGHEGVGWVVDATPRAHAWLADQDTPLAFGDRVVVFPFLPCSGIDAQGSPTNCSACLADRPEECSTLRALGIDADGLLTQWCDLPPQILHRVPAVWPSNDQAWTDLLYTESVSQALVAATTPALATARHIAVVGRGAVQELTARVVEAVHFGWSFTNSRNPTPTPPPVGLTHSTPQEFDAEQSAQTQEAAQAQQQGREEAWLSSIRVHRLDPSALPRHPRAFDVIIETWADPASLADMFQALRGNGVLVRKSRPGRGISLLRQAAPMMPVRVVQAPYGSFGSALSWMAKHPGSLRDLDQDAHRWNSSRLATPSSHQAQGGFPFTAQGCQDAMEADRRRDQIGKVFLKIHDAQPNYD